MGTLEVKGAELQTIARWAVEGESSVDVTLQNRPTRYAVGWEEGDAVATQGDAHSHVDCRGSVKDAVPDDLVAAPDADV